MIPLYKYSLDEAKEYGEAEEWCDSLKENIRCRNFLDEQVRQCYKDNILSPEGLENTVKEFGYDRTMWVIANTITVRKGDGRFHRQNNDWARAFAIPQSGRNYEFALNSHSCLVDGLADQVRRMYKALGFFGSEHTVRSNEPQDYTDKLLIIRDTVLAEEYRTPENQLFFAKAGFGCDPTASGRKVFGQFLSDGEKTHFNRSDFVGVIADEHIPDWAREKLAEMSAKQNNTPKMDM